MTKLSYRLIMRSAWNLAKRGSHKFGGKAVDYLAESLKAAWKIYKRQKNRFNTDIAGIMPWFIKKELGISVRNINEDSELKIIRETTKAALIKCTIYAMDKKTVISYEQFWAPKSVIF